MNTTRLQNVRGEMDTFRSGRQLGLANSFGCIPPIFRSPFLEKVAFGTHLPAFAELSRYFVDFNPPSPDCLLRDWFDFFYNILCERYRCEYIYKNAIATNIFLSRHSFQHSYMTSEIRSAKSRADVAILNGTSTVYEIKSQFDSFDRLEGQLEDYKKVFDKIYVVTTEVKAAYLLDHIPMPVGIIALRNNGALRTVRECESNKENIDPSTAFDCMRQSEFCRAVSGILGPIPSVPNSQLYRTARNMFISLSPSVAHDLMVQQLKSRETRKPFTDLIDGAPVSLKHACLSLSKSDKIANKIAERLNSPLL